MVNNIYKILLRHHEPNRLDKDELWCSYGILTSSSNTYSKEKVEFKEFETDDINVLKKTFLELNIKYGCEDIRIVNDIKYSHDINISYANISSNNYDIYTEDDVLIIQGDDITTSSSDEISQIKINDKEYDIKDNKIREEIPTLIQKYVEENSESLKGTDGYSPTATVTKTGNTTTVSITDKNGTSTSKIVDGIDGSDGKDGYSPVVQVSEINNGYNISITDLNGEKTFEIYNGTDGLNGSDGSNGIDGYSPTIVEKTNEPGNYVLTITDKNNSFDTPNLRTYLEYKSVQNDSDTVIYNLSPNVITKFYNPVKDLTVNFVGASSYGEYTFIFTTSDVGCTLTLPVNVLWNNDSPPVLKANKIYEVSVSNISAMAVICEASV